MDPLTHIFLARTLIDKRPTTLLAGVVADAPWYLTYPIWLFRQGQMSQAFQTNQWPSPPRWMDILHNAAHSLVIALGVIGILRLLSGHWKHPCIHAWILHILIDIPTHSKQNWGTRFLWPISDFAVDGIPWAEILIRMLRPQPNKDPRPTP